MEGRDGLTWALRVDPPLSGAENMAWDHALALACPQGEALLRLYRWAVPTLSLGRNEPARGVVDPIRLREEGVDLVRRPTGGRTVLHHHELTYAVVAPIRALGGVRAAYATLNRGLARGLATLGVPVRLAGPGPAAHPDAGPCFGEPAQGEVLAGAGKLVGSAQVRLGNILLQHGSILIRDDQGLIPLLRTREAGRSSPSAGSAALETVLGRRVEVAEVQEAVLAGFREVVPGDWRGAAERDSLARDTLPPSPDRALLEKYRSREWSWRR